VQNILAGFHIAGFVCEIAFLGRMVDFRGQDSLVFFQVFLDFILGPEVVFAFHTFAVRILGREKTTLMRRHFPQNVFKDLSDGVCIYVVFGG